MKKLTLGCRLLLGLIFVVFGSNGLLMFLTGSGFIPMPEPPPEMMTVMGGLMAMSYLMPLVKLIEVVAGLLLLANRYVNLAITLLGPIVINIFGIHLFVEPSGLAMGIVVLALWTQLLFSRWSDFKVLLKA